MCGLSWKISLKLYSSKIIKVYHRKSIVSKFYASNYSKLTIAKKYLLRN